MYLSRTAQNHAITHFHVLAMISELSRGFAAMPICDGVNGLFYLLSIRIDLTDRDILVSSMCFHFQNFQ